MPNLSRGVHALRFALVLLAAACQSGNAERAPATGSVPADEELQAAALEWVIARVETNLDPPAAYCIALMASEFDERREPPAALLTHLRADAAAVRPVSGCRSGGPIADGSRYESEANVVIDRATQRFALYFGIEPVRWKAGAVAEVGVHYLQGGLWGAGYICRAERERVGTWRVTGCERTYQS